MITFQLIFIPLLLLLVVWDIARLFQPHSRRPYRLMRILVWLVAAGLIYNPDITGKVARVVGITRGTDLVVYLFMLTVPVVLFHLYAKQFAIQRDLVILARRDAIRHAEPGEGLHLEGPSQS